MGYDPNSTSRIARVLAVAGALWLVGCNLPGIPNASPETGPNRDGELQPDTAPRTDTSAHICTPNELHCWDRSVVVCSEDGRRRTELRDCADDEICQNGSCRPLKNDCDTTLPLRLSASELRFDSNDRLRADTASFLVQNCSEQSIRLSGVTMTQPETSHRRPVFEIANRTSIADVPIPPGDRLRVKLRYRPRLGFFLPGRTPHASVDVRAQRPFVSEIDLYRRIDCVSVAPVVDAGRLEPNNSERVEVPLYNCGNQGAVVQYAADGEVLEETEDVTVRRPDEAPDSVVLAPGEFGDLPVVLQGDPPDGTVALSVPFQTTRIDAPEGNERFSTRIAAQFERSSCLSEPVPAAAYRLEPPKEDGAPFESGDEATTAPFEPIWFRTEAGTEMSTPLSYEIVGRPEGSHARIQRVPDRPHLRRFEPDAVGTYRFRVRLRDAQGVPSCGSRAFDLQVVPEAGLYAELRSKTPDDPLPQDRGYGRGPDLNLHVLARSDDAPSIWNDRRYDCFQPGRRITRQCPAGGAIRATNVSGSGPEAIAYDALEADAYCVAVHAWNTYRFDDNRASLRLFADGELVTDEPLEHRLGAANGAVWYAGCYNPSSDSFTPDGRIRKSF